MPTNGATIVIVRRLGDMVKIGEDPWKPYRKLTVGEKEYVNRVLKLGRK